MLSKKPVGQPVSVTSSMMILRPSRWMETVPHGSSSSLGSLTARELPLLKIFVFMEECMYLGGCTVKMGRGKVVGVDETECSVVL